MLLEAWQVSCLRQPQHGRDWRYCTFFAKIVLRIFGFFLRTWVGTSWLKAMSQSRIAEGAFRAPVIQFKHLIGAQDGSERVKLALR